MAMEMAIRQDIQRSVERAQNASGYIALARTDGGVSILRCDLTCELDCVEGTDRDGRWVSVPYDDIAEVRAA